MFDEEFRPMPMTSRSSSSPQGSESAAAAGSDPPPILEPCDVVLLSPEVDIVMQEDNNFHIADEHPLFQQVEEMEENAAVGQPQQQRRGWRGCGAGRRGTPQRGRGRGRASRRAHGQVPIGDSQWMRGERLVEIFVDDDDVPEEA